MYRSPPACFARVLELLDLPPRTFPKRLLPAFPFVLHYLGELLLRQLEVRFEPLRPQCAWRRTID